MSLDSYCNTGWVETTPVVGKTLLELSCLIEASSFSILYIFGPTRLKAIDEILAYPQGFGKEH